MENKKMIKLSKMEFLCKYSYFDESDMIKLIKSCTEPVTDEQAIEYFDNYALDNLDDHEYDCYKSYTKF